MGRKRSREKAGKSWRVHLDEVKSGEEAMPESRPPLNLRGVSR